MVFVPRRSPIPVSVDQARIEEIEAERTRYAALLVDETATADTHLDQVYRPVLETLVAAPECNWLWGWESWVLATQYHHAVVRLGTSPRGTEFEWMVEHKERHLVSPGPLAGADASTWTRAFYLALVGRDQMRVRDLASVPVERLREVEGTEQPAYLYHWVSALQALINGDDQLIAHLRSAMELSDPSQTTAGLSALELNLLVFPQLDLLRAFLGGEPEEFEQTLVRGLESFENYHAREEGQQDPLAQVLPLGQLALATLAFDRVDHDPDYRMDVRSDYLPRALLERSWYKEFPV